MNIFYKVFNIILVLTKNLVHCQAKYLYLISNYTLLILFKHEYLTKTDLISFLNAIVIYGRSRIGITCGYNKVPFGN